MSFDHKDLENAVRISDMGLIKDITTSVLPEKGLVETCDFDSFCQFVDLKVIDGGDAPAAIRS